MFCAAAPLATVAGCLFPMPIDEQPVEENQPPFYLSSCVEPPPNRLVDYDPEVDGDQIVFSVCAFGDPNVEDRLFFRWFVNYDPQGFNFQAVASDRSPSNPPATMRQGPPIEFTLTPCSQLRPFPDVTLHRIELIVADRPFEESPAENPFPNRMLPEDARDFRLTWFLDAHRCPR